MKKVLAIAVVICLATSVAYAGPMGPIKPTQGRWSLEAEGSSDNRDMEWTTNNVDKTRAENVNYLGRISYGLTDKVEIYGRLGGADLDVVDLVDATNAAENTFNGSSQFAWGVGVSGILYDAGTWNIGATANYLDHNDHSGNSTPTVVQNNDVDFDEWNVGLQIQGKYDQFQPFLGVKYSDARIDYNRVGGAVVNWHDDAEDNVGVYVGTGFDLTPQWSGYVEGRFIDETSFGGGIRYTF